MNEYNPITVEIEKDNEETIHSSHYDIDNGKNKETKINYSYLKYENSRRLEIEKELDETDHYIRLFTKILVILIFILVICIACLIIFKQKPHKK